MNNDIHLRSTNFETYKSMIVINLVISENQVLQNIKNGNYNAFSPSFNINYSSLSYHTSISEWK